MTRLLICGGCVIDTESGLARPGTDVLVDGDTIAEVGPDLPDDGAEVIDASGHIVLPGLVDTHRHTWETVLRSIAPNATLGDYLERVIGGFGPRFRPEDVYAGNLAGATECLDAGITTLLDWSHIQLTPAHTDAAIQALHDAGVRAVFGYAHRSPEVRAPAEARRAHDAVGGLVGMALAAWGPAYASIADTEADWNLARELGCRITVHVHGEGPVDALAERGLLGPDTTYVHASGLTDREMKLIADSGGTASVTPFIEAQMGFGLPEVARLRRFGVTTALGVDAVTSVPGDLFAHMRGAFAFGRMDDESMTTADVLRMATLDGATALGMDDEIGSLRPGKRADIVLLRTDAPNMTPVGDPIGAVVTSAGVGDVDTVLVAGRVAKRSGRLTHPDARHALDLARHSADHLASRVR